MTRRQRLPSESVIAREAALGNFIKRLSLKLNVGQARLPPLAWKLETRPRESMRLQPVLAHADFDDDRHVQRNRGFHPPFHGGSDFRLFRFVKVEQEFI